MSCSLVSILTPSFNQARWLSDNLDSVAVQTYPNVEHIVMDGGSADGSVALLEAAGDGVRWRSEPDSGQSDALNKAFAASSGDIIGWLNSDDAYFDVDVVRDVVGYFERHPDVDVVYGHAAYVNSDGLILHMMWAPPFARRLLQAYDFIVQPAVFIRRRVLDHPMLDETFHFAMDYELWLRLAKRGRIGRMNRVLAIDRVQPERKSLANLDVFESDIERLREMYGVAMTQGWSRRLQSVVHVLGRLLGVRLLIAARGKLAFCAQPSSAGALLKRQVAGRRSRMIER